jgi:hypothetical protein
MHVIVIVLGAILSIKGAIAAPFSELEKMCLVDTSSRFGIDKCILKSVLIAEGGTPGLITLHANGSKDMGRGQINKGGAWSRYLAKIGVSEDQITKNPCVNIGVTGFILREELDKVNGNLELGIANYHAGYSYEFTARRQRYFDRVLNIYSMLHKKNEC